jgi:uncharacterized protein
MKYLDFPFHTNSLGKIADTDLEDHIRDLIFQVLFTDPGERVNRPDFGCGLRRMVFTPMNDVLLTTTEFMVQGALQRALYDLIRVEMVRVISQEDQCEVQISYSLRSDGIKRTDSYISTTGGVNP